jgi:RNA polymerase sigma factor (sigma-70 family)
MTEGDGARRLLAEEYQPKILGFCHLKVGAEDAGDLAQEIALQILRAIDRGARIENMNAYVWRVSQHTFYKWLRAKRRGGAAYLTELFPDGARTEEDYIRKEEKSALRRELALLSQKYRETLVLHYFEGRSCEEIAEILGKSPGTVKWWLHGARKRIREGMDTMREYGEKSYRPETLQLSCQGNPGADEEPMRCAARKSAQNILLAAYRAPMTAEELSVELGVAAVYIEDEVGYLRENQLMREVSPGKFQTDFVILPDGNPAPTDEIRAACFPAYSDALLAWLESRRDALSGGKFNTAGFAWERLLWVYVHLFTDACLVKFKREACAVVSPPERPNGGRWIALGFQSGFLKPRADWKPYHAWDGPVHKPRGEGAQGFFHAWSGLDSGAFFELPDGVFALGREIIEKRVVPEDLDEARKYLFSTALEKRLFVREDGGFRQNYYYAAAAEYRELERLALGFYPEAAQYFQTAWERILRAYEADVPKRLRWQMGNFLSNNLNAFVTNALYDAMARGALSAPGEGREWLSLFATE